MEKFNKKELLSTIDNQKDEILRYKTRLRDVITAYKGLQKEKEAIESSFKAVSGSGGDTRPSRRSSNVAESSEESPISNDSVATSDMARSRTENKGQKGETTEGLRIQLSTLMNSLSTLSAEKSRMEASFQADKKQLRVEKEEREKKIVDLQDRLQNMTKQRSTDTEMLKSKLIVERHEREKEQNDHGVMIRELQKLLSEDRRSKEQLEKQVDDLRSQLAAVDVQASQSELYERRLRDLSNELESARRKAKRAESRVSEPPPPLLMELQDEMSQMRRQHQAAIAAEQKRAADAERLAANNEQRVASLEGRLAELSDTVGNYDRLRHHDQQAISKLKERIAQMDLEHSVQPRRLARVESGEDLKGKSEADLSNDVQEILKKIVRLKGQLVLANQRSEKPIDIAAAFNADEYFADVHRNCQEDYQQLEHKFELYKLKTSSQQPNNARQATEKGPILDAQIRSLKETNHILRAQLEDTERDCKRKLSDQDQLAKAERAKHKEQTQATESDHRRQLLSLEEELKKQRDRSMKLLEEKDQEIQTLKSTFQMLIPGSAGKSSPGSSAQGLGVLSDDVVSSLSQLGSVLRGGNSPHMLHYAHELSRRDVEISALRKANYGLECSLREMQRDTARHSEKAKAKVKSLQDEVGRFERCQSRESANLEYLKNVVLSFLLSKKASSKQHMLNAIAAVLKFSTEELEKVNQIYVGATGT